MTKQIHVNVGYGALSDKDVATQGVAVVDGMTNNPKLVNPPINPADLKTQVETFASLIAAAADGSKKAITERKKQRAVVVKMLRQLGHWVEANCNDDAATLKSSGYQEQATPVRNASPQPLAGPPSFKVENGPISGQVVMRGKPVLKAVSYTVHYAPIGSDGKPGSWTEMSPVTVIRSITVNGLTPGTAYAFQVRGPGPGRLYELERLRNSHGDVVRQNRPLPRKRGRAIYFGVFPGLGVGVRRRPSALRRNLLIL